MSNKIIASMFSTKPSRLLNVSLWIGQVLLAVAFAAAGVMKSTMPIAELAQQLPWVNDVPAALVRFIGFAELAGALGLILPSVTRIGTVLTPIAAFGLVAVMALAAGFHLGLGQVEALPVNFMIGALAGFVAWGRAWRAPITARGQHGSLGSGEARLEPARITHR